ncbi:CIC11C00000003142 [Sungouiella intermedia]|uniref:CIC11C00000003142 n=1 Tax=Sungouiella intermedia TaxID=45354 RepID=A0A1L0G1X2_9ASCO|nr:CIC11C00000003142 [[Candida] intermedia]
MSDPEKLSPDQEAVLMELEMILTTVKQIDSNLQKSIALLDDKSIDYTEIVHTNTRRIVEILELLGATHQ